ncbi:MAG: sugar ABC transporter ATP-binding protein [candidate division Zixibacteria bacterium]|nr:sugar ABC transporter ATP-binding protein [candidate division Zixibacteria bacterium]NIW49406.1 ATP-binding cassette domain-containing protein [Gammaproteobacteria bacterium]NIR67311.1 sugar ABC transporter ATP-binding protein [candidate division Zixibacteria bacterium]NIS48688.1 sugar ABC transporter ATP-binding protein [candidate division Zixibacteria bacterium]NIT52553.1 sugar ABC transporter ATP-binding protein [candidate division Zixibacteria bacterium]
MNQTAEKHPVVEMRNIKKYFGGVHALRGVDLVLHENEVLGLVGDNAAGKSTLMKVLSGAYIPTDGDIFIEGKKAHFTNPMDARRQGIEMVYQDYALANNLDVTANVFLGREVVRISFGPFGVLDYHLMEQETRNLMNRLKIDIPSVRQKVERLSGGQRQAVAIARATAFDAKVIIMDEPTAALSVAAIDKVLELVRELKAQGSSIIMISHRLEDIYQVSDRMIVLRRGRKVSDTKVEGDLHEFRENVVAYMIGARDDYAHENDVD